MQILRKVGVAFHESEAIAIFKKLGAKTDDSVVYLDEKLVESALESTPSQFTITARNPQHNITIGGENLVFAPGYGAAFVISKTGEQSQAAMEDYDNFCKLVQTSDYIDMNGFLMVTPWDVPTGTAHLHMLFSNLTLCDKAFIGCSLSRQGAIDALEMAGIVWGDKQNIKNKPVMISLISAISPLIFSQEMSAALIELAKYGQPLVMTGGPKAGSTGPVTLAGVLALQNAQILAGIVLAQSVNPGTPIAYGGICGPMDFRTGIIPDGAPEVSKMTSAIAQLAKYYDIPSRSGGALTDAHVPDIQAGVESALGLATAAESGIHLIIHACGLLGSFIGFSYEKFIIDEELCAMVRNLLEPITITMDEIDLKTIEQVGIGGEFLTHQKTLERCRTEFYLTNLMNRLSYESWTESGEKRLEQTAEEMVTQRLSSYQRPSMDPDIEQALSLYVAKRENR
jgi:trimethylamine--corrinoid protein Co-methyltransferase